MGNKKRSLLEKIKEGDQIRGEAIESGEELEGDGREIKSLLDGIDTSMDEDDVAAVKTAESGYRSDFNAEFRETVETRGEEVKRVETDVSAESKSELGKVNEAAEAFRSMEGVSDVGRGNAEGGADRMRDSAAEYEEYIDEANTIIEDTQNDIESLRGSIDSIFG